MTKSAISSKKKRRKGRRRVHKGRLALVISVLALFIVVTMAIVSRACGDEEIVRAGGDFRPPVPSAIERGHADARRALAFPAGSMERQDVLFEIHAREYSLRESGHAHAADDYINSATDYLRSHGAL